MVFQTCGMVWAFPKPAAMIISILQAFSLPTVKRGTLTLRVRLGGEMVEIEGDHALMRDLGRELFNSAEPAPSQQGIPPVYLISPT